MSFLRHRETHQSAELRFRKDCELWRARLRRHALAHRIDESPVGYSLAGCSPAEPASASPTVPLWEPAERGWRSLCLALASILALPHGQQVIVGA